MPDWVDVTIRTRVDPAELLSLLDDSAVCGAWQDGDVVHLYWPSPDWTSDRIARLQAACARLGVPVMTEAITANVLPHRDWNESWARAVQPVRIGRVIIRPSWQSTALNHGDVELVIDPKQAFGTGHHATTQMLIQWLQELIVGGESVLDVGTGSGILAMVALKLGAKRAVGIDHDPVAIDCARQYAAQNGFGDELSLQVMTLAAWMEAGVPSADVVLANLDRQLILDSIPSLAAYAKAGARLLLSGILAEQLTEVQTALAVEAVYVRKVREREGWIALEAGAAAACDESPSETSA